MTVEEFTAFPEMIRAVAAERPHAIALVLGNEKITYLALDRSMDRIAASFQKHGIRSGESIAIAGATSLAYVTLFLGALRAGIVVAPLAPSSTAEGLAAMIADCGAKCLFLDTDIARTIARVRGVFDAAIVDLERDLDDWTTAEDSAPALVELKPEMAFNIIYSSGTTGTPKGIVHSHRMRFGHIRRAIAMEYGPNSKTILSTPLYSNTTLVSLIPTLAFGGTAILMKKFDVSEFLDLAERHRATHAMLVPVQYARLMASPAFDRHDLSSFRLKLCTSAPFAAELKAEVVKRWPGGLIEIYGMTEGGGTCLLPAHLHPDKLHTVGQPAAGHDIRIIDEGGRELPRGAIGEIVGSSPAMMSGYHNRPEQTEAALWRSLDGKSFMRTGDIGRFDIDGFLELLDRKKDMIISGGFNIYPSDLESILRQHSAVIDGAVVGAPSVEWGETPVAFVVLRQGAKADEVKAYVNARVGKTQRLADVRQIAELPRSPIGKVLKRDLRILYAGSDPSVRPGETV